jgi:2-polyprenyl-3-methyl-5-hydroxy-6-metoxy-1,4-benzoquinol methylase
VGGRDYRRCDACRATFLEPAQRLSREEEHAQYLLHQNDAGDPAYRRFLSKLANPLLSRLSPRAEGLDYGCGPGPALAQMLREAGHVVSLYDPFFAPDRSALDRTYDFITCTEAAEHFHAPADELDRLGSIVRPGGLIAIMTSFQVDDDLFAGWHYRRDPTHVVFYQEATFHHVAEQRGWRCEIPVRDIALLTLP